MNRKLGFWVTLLVMLGLIWSVEVMADEGVPALTVKGKTENITLDFNEAPDIQVLTPDAATALIVEAERISPGGEHQQWSEDFDRYRIRPCLEMRSRFFDTGTWQVTARYTTDDYEDGTNLYEADLDWTVLGTVDVSVNNWLARMNAPAVSLSSTTVSQGDWINVTVSNFQNKNEWYWYELSRMNDESGDWEGSEHRDVSLKEGISDTFAVPTLDLEPGYYRLWIRTEAVRYEDAGTFKTFTVTENSGLSDGLFLSTSAETAQVPVMISMRADGADRMCLSYTLDEDPFYTDQNEWDGDNTFCSKAFDRPGTWRLTLTAWEGEDSYVVDTKVLTVSAGGRLAYPGYSDFPGVLAAGQGLTGTITLDSRTEQYGMDLQFCPDDGDQEELYNSYREDFTPEQAIRLPASLFTRDGLYRLHVHTYAMGLESSYNEYWFIRSASGEAGSDVALEVNGSTDDITLPSSSDVHFRVTAPAATAARVLINGSWEYRNSPAEFEFGRGIGTGDFALVAQITTDTPVWQEDGFDWGSFSWENDVNWDACSNTVILHAEAPNGRLDVPEVTLEKATVSRNEWVHATVSSQDHDEWYWAQVRRPWTDDYGNAHWDHIMDCDGSNDITFPAAGLTPGEYYLCVGVSALGWENAERNVPFTVTEGETGDLALYFADSEILTTQDITFYAYAAGADHMSVDVTWNKDSNWNNHYGDGGEWNSWNWSCSESGTYIFTLEAWQDGNSLGTASYELTVSAPYGTLDAPAVEEIPVVLEQNTAVSGSFTVDSRAENVNVKLYFCPDDGDWERLYEDDRHMGDSGLTDLFLDGSLFNRTGIYHLEIHSSARGYNGGHFDRQILVTDEGMQQGLTLTVNGGSDEDIYLHQNVPVTVTAPEGVTAVRLWSSSYDWWECHANVEGELEWYWGFHRAGDETLVAQATTDTSVLEWLDDHGDMWDFDWSQVSWTMTSSPVTVPVICLGRLDNPEVDFPDGTLVERGGTLPMLVSPVENAYGFGVQVRRADDDRWNWLVDIEYAFRENGTTVLLPTDGLPAGDYMVHIDPRRYGWDAESIGYPFTVTEGASWTDEAVFRVTPSEVLTLDYITMSVYAPGASEVKVCSETAENEWNRRQGEALTATTMLNWDRVYHLMAFAYYPGDGNDEGGWQQIGDTVEVSAAAPNGNMDIIVAAPARKSTADSWTISLLCDFKGVEGYPECWIYREDNGWEQQLEVVRDGTAGGFSCFTYQIDANTLEPGVYSISAYAFPLEIGYAVGSYEGVVEITDETIEPALTTLTLPADLLTIEEEAFAGVAAEKIVIPDGVTAIASNAFTDCPNLVELVLPPGITSFASDALGTTGPVFVSGQEGSYLEDYANSVENLYFIPAG